MFVCMYMLLARFFLCTSAERKLITQRFMVKLFFAKESNWKYRLGKTKTPTKIQQMPTNNSTTSWRRKQKQQQLHSATECVNEFIKLRETDKYRWRFKQKFILNCCCVENYKLMCLHNTTKSFCTILMKIAGTFPNEKWREKKTTLKRP